MLEVIIVLHFCGINQSSTESIDHQLGDLGTIDYLSDLVN